MSERKPMSRTVRFEVFKRDKFTCQYCGKKAPDVVLHVDHIHPVAEGGTNEMMNLISACADCNGGKGARLLDDASVVDKQRAQIEELEERRQQLEMMLEWRRLAEQSKREEVDVVDDAIAAKSGFNVNENGKADIRRWLKRYSLDLLLRAVDESFETYLIYNDDKPTDPSWNTAFSRIPSVANVLAQEESKPYLRELLYIQGIVRNRIGWKRYDCVDLLERAVLAGAALESVKAFAKSVDDINEFEAGINDFLQKQARKS
ncbi:MAG: HNH endonuclease [Alphaproteobacteria bacterium]